MGGYFQEIVMASVSKRKWTYKGVTKEAWTVRYLDRGGEHRSKAFELKKQADEFRKKVERELDDGTHISQRSTKTINAVIDEYMASLDRKVQEGQMATGSLRAIARYLAYPREFMGDDLMSTVTWQRVEEFGIWLRCRNSKNMNKPLANATISCAMTKLSTLFGYGVRRGYAAQNVVPSANAELGSLPSVPIKTFSETEVKALLKALDAHCPATRRTRAMKTVVYLGLMCGLRKGEIFALRWSSIDFTLGTIRIDKSITRLDELKSPKTEAGVRTVPMPSKVAAALSGWKTHCVEDDRGLIFRTWGGGEIGDQKFYLWLWYPLLAKAGLDGGKGSRRRFHATRHFAGSMWLNSGMPLPEVSRLLGHANTGITARVYSHAVTEVGQQAGAINACANHLFENDIAQGLRMAA
jgi:integrase